MSKIVLGIMTVGIIAILSMFIVGQQLINQEKSVLRDLTGRVNAVIATRKDLEQQVSVQETLATQLQTKLAEEQKALQQDRISLQSAVSDVARKQELLRQQQLDAQAQEQARLQELARQQAIADALAAQQSRRTRAS